MSWPIISVQLEKSIHVCERKKPQHGGARIDQMYVDVVILFTRAFSQGKQGAQAAAVHLRAGQVDIDPADIAGERGIDA
jgi:hypothetical protein